MKWLDIPQLPRVHYSVNVSWKYLEEQIERHTAADGGYGLELNPDFQRVHVWTLEQRVAYIEYALMGGEIGKRLIFVCENWNSGVGDLRGYALLDGKQRLKSVRMFLRSEISVFKSDQNPNGLSHKEFEGYFKHRNADFLWCIVECRTRADVLGLYLQLNAGGTPHTPEELDRVRAMKAELLAK